VSRLKRFLFTEVGVVRLLMIIPSLLKVKSFFRARIKNSDALIRNEFCSKTALNSLLCCNRARLGKPDPPGLIKH